MKNLGDPIYFSDFRFHAGVNMTIRRGVEWDLAPKGVYLAKHPWENRESFPVKIFETRVIRFQDMPISWIDYLHNNSGLMCLSEVLAQLNTIYPHFNPNEIVTCVFFRIEKKTEKEDARPKKTTRSPRNRDKKAAPEKGWVEEKKV